MKTAILYGREIRGENVFEQIEACRAFALAHDLVPVATVIDMLTAQPAYRLGLRGALDMVGAGDVPVLVALSAEHVSKDPVRLGALQETLAERNCAFLFVQPG